MRIIARMPHFDSCRWICLGAMRFSTGSICDNGAILRAGYIHAVIGKRKGFLVRCRHGRGCGGEIDT
jgi:hypothetical protein